MDSPFPMMVSMAIWSVGGFWLAVKVVRHGPEISQITDKDIKQRTIIEAQQFALTNRMVNLRLIIVFILSLFAMLAVWYFLESWSSSIAFAIGVNILCGALVVAGYRLYAPRYRQAVIGRIERMRSPSCPDCDFDFGGEFYAVCPSCGVDIAPPEKFALEAQPGHIDMRTGKGKLRFAYGIGMIIAMMALAYLQWTTAAQDKDCGRPGCEHCARKYGRPVGESNAEFMEQAHAGGDVAP